MTWTTKIKYVDRNTGELLTPQHVLKGHYIITAKKITHERINDQFGEKRILCLCEGNRQLNLNL